MTPFSFKPQPIHHPWEEAPAPDSMIEVAPGVRVGSVITTDSVDRLGLAVGGRAVAVIKATEVMVGIE